MKIISVIEYLNKLDRGLWGRPGSRWKSHQTYKYYWDDAIRIYSGIQS